MTPEDDLSVNGPGSPISLRKVIEKGIIKKKLTVLIDGTNSGFYTEDSGVITLDSDIFKLHALEFQSVHFNQKQLPLYMIRHLLFFFYDKQELVYPHDTYIFSDLEDFITKDPEGMKVYAEILNKITYIKNNAEWQQILGLIITFCGCLSLSQKLNKWAKLYLEFPENNLHPKRQALLMTFIHEVYNQYTGQNLQDDI